MTYRVRFTERADADLKRLFSFLANEDLVATERARETVAEGLALLERFPFSCRMEKTLKNPRWRELVISFGRSGYVMLFEIQDARHVRVTAVRHQRKDDFF